MTVGGTCKTLSPLFLIFFAVGCEGKSAPANDVAADARGKTVPAVQNIGIAKDDSPEGWEPTYGWVYDAGEGREGPEALYGVIQGETDLALTCNRRDQTLSFVAMGLPDREASQRDIIRIGDVRAELPMRWEPFEYAGESLWQSVTAVPMSHPLAAALGTNAGPIVFEMTADRTPARIPSDPAVRRVVRECRAGRRAGK